MPFVTVSVSKKLSREQMTQIKAGLGQGISVIEGKSEAVTWIKIDDCNTLYKAGEEQLSAAFVEVRLYGPSKYEEKKAFADCIYKTLSDVAAIEPSFVSINMPELDCWGGGGNFNTRL